MKTKLAFGTLVLALAVTLLPASAGEGGPGKKKKKPAPVSVRARAKGFYDARSGGGKTNLVDSHVRVHAGVEDREAILRSLEGIPGEKRVLFEATIDVSGVPYLMANSVRDELSGRLDETLAEKTPLVRAAVAAKMAENPQFGKLPEAMRSAMIEKVTVDQIAAIRAAKSGTLDRRVDDLRLETSIQQVVVGVTGVLGDGQALVYLDLGKMKVNGGGPTDIHGETEIDALRPTKSAAQNAGSTATTGAIKGGYSSIVETSRGPARLTFEAYVFHDRLPFLNAEYYVANAANMSDEEFARHRRWWKMDSALFRALMETRDFDVYLTVGSYAGKGAVTAGATYRITPKNEISVSGAMGGRDVAKSSFSAYFVHKPSAHASLYGGFERLNSAKDATVSLERSIDRSEIVVGGGYQFLRLKFADVSGRAEAYRQTNAGMKPVVGVRLGLAASIGKKKAVAPKPVP